LGTCAPIAGANVQSFEKEADMLRAWRDLVIWSDPDVLTGYNIVGFDIPYLVDRAKVLGVDNFKYIGRLQSVLSTIRKVVMSSKQSGAR
jgi:DNA polymerase delta subunit 1